MDRATYSEGELVQNRVSVLLSGGTAVERKAWAEEAASRLGCPLTVVVTADTLPQALALKDGVVLVEGVLGLGDGAQQQLARCLQTQEERPKLVVAVQQAAEAAYGGEGLRPDLHYALRLAQVNLEEPGLRETLRARRLTPPPARRPTAAPARVPVARSAGPRRAAKKSSTRPRPSPPKRSRR